VSSKNLAPKFTREAERILSLEIAQPANACGGYGINGEIIYTSHPNGCPSILVDKHGETTVTYFSNGSLSFSVKTEDGFEVQVLESSFDPVVKRETGVLQHNIWLEVNGNISSLLTPQQGVNFQPERIKVVKIGDPKRAMWYTAEFKGPRDIAYSTAVKYSLAITPEGPALKREVYIKNTGRKPLQGKLWTYFNLHGTQEYVYNKDIWYDRGLPLDNREIVVAGTVPYRNLTQVKRISSHTFDGLTPVDSTCDYLSFIGDSGAISLRPQAVVQGGMLARGAGRRLNRFATPTIAASDFNLRLNPGKSTGLQQTLLYISRKKTADEFARLASTDSPEYTGISRAFIRAARWLVRRTLSARQIAALAGTTAKTGAGHPHFSIALSAQPRLAAYANSAWLGVEELYEKCRSAGSALANGIELGTRDRLQDMWPKVKQDPAQIGRAHV
jgi:hypothetical protein